MFFPTSVERHYRCVILGTGVFLFFPFVFAYDFVSGPPVSCFPSSMALNNQFGKPGNKSKVQIVM